MKLRILGVIPARSGSKRLKDKNVRKINGLPLIAFTIKSAIESKVFDRVIVSTDSSEYAYISEQYGAKVDFIRPSYLSTSDAKSIDLIRHAINYYESRNNFFEVVCLLQPTSPLRTHKHIIEAFNIFKENLSDSVISVVRGKGSKICLTAKSENHLLKFDEIIDCNQKDKITYYPNGAIYIFKINYIKNNDDFYTNKTYLYNMSKKISIDIDTQEDFDKVELVLKNSSM
jgi:CMP-N,N'-diacetyllegionaminic acid synthase